MKVNYLVLVILFSWNTTLGQNGASFSRTSENNPPQKHKINWKVNPFEGKVFIENRGQFDTLLKSDTKVWYGAELGAVKAYFTSEGLTYRYDEYPKKRDAKEENEEAEQEAFKIRKTHYFKILWEGANPDVTIEASEKRSDYFVYATGPASSLEANVFKKITYRNLYPGIDVEYIFPKDKEGLKYTVIVHPGADVTKVKTTYIGARSLKESKEGDVIIKTEMGDFIDHAPISYYEGETNHKVFTKFNLRRQGGSFLLPDSYDANKTLVIDPWITNPFGGTADGWDIDYDYNGNVYSGSSYGLVKLNSAGTLIWTYKGFSGVYCDFTVDRVTGNSFIVGLVADGIVQKISTTGGLIGSFNSPPPCAGCAREFWRAVWNPCTDQVVIGGGGTGGTAGRYQGAIINTNLTGFNFLNVVAAPSSSRDMVGVAIDPAGTTCYMACCFRIPYNVLVKLPLPPLTPTLFNVNNGYQFSEQSHNRYAGSFQNGMNIMAAGNNGVYMWDGYTLSKFNKTTGALITSNAILPPVIVAGGIGTSVKTFWCGIDVDACERLYVGYQTTIKVFNTSLVQTSVINLPSNLDTVHDVAIGYKGKTLYACGEKFVTSIDVAGQATDSIAKTTTPASCSCNGTATASLLVQCGNPVSAGVTYSWSNGQTTQTATGLCAGIHNVTLTYNCKPYPDTVKITSPSGLAITQSQTNVQCYGGNTGSSTTNVTGGTAPYTYSWSPAAGTNATAGSLTAGTYTVSVTDANGCKILSIVQITQPNPPITGTSSVNNSCTTTGSASVTVGVSTPYLYTWSNGATGPTTNGLIAGNYTVTVTDGNGCSQTKIFTITGTNPVSATFTQSKTNACTNTAVIFTHTGTTGTHSWSITPGLVSGTTTNFSYTFLSAGTYTVTHTVTNAGCTATVTRNVYITNCSAPTVTATGSSVCPGSCATATSSGSGGTSPYTYSWSNGATTQNISPCPSATTTYTVTIRDAGGITSTSTAIVMVNPAVNLTTTATGISCNGGADGSVSASAGSGTAPYVYTWSNGQTTSTTTGLSSGSYTVTATDSKGCTATSTTSLISPPPFAGQFTKGTANCASCGCKEWIMVTGTGGTSPYSYTWPDSYVNRYKNQLCPGAYTINIKDKNGCSINVNLSAP